MQATRARMAWLAALALSLSTMGAAASLPGEQRTRPMIILVVAVGLLLCGIGGYYLKRRRAKLRVGHQNSIERPGSPGLADLVRRPAPQSKVDEAPERAQEDVLIVQIRAFGARILRVTRQGIDYIDEAGRSKSIDLEECARNWGGRRADRAQEFRSLPGWTEQDAAAWNQRCVGQRGACDDPPWAEFMAERRTRFEFASSEALYQELLTPLKRAGWHTFDAN